MPKQKNSQEPDSEFQPFSPKQEAEWSVVENWPDLRCAEPGDRGRIIGVVSHEGTGLLRLVLSVDRGVLLLLPGGFRQISDILDTMGFEEVDVVASVGSPYGFHDVRLAQLPESLS